MSSLLDSMAVPQQPQQLNPMQLMQMARDFKGTPEQAKQQLCEQIASMGWTREQLDQFLNQVDTMYKQLGGMPMR